MIFGPGWAMPILTSAACHTPMMDGVNRSWSQGAGHDRGASQPEQPGLYPASRSARHRSRSLIPGNQISERHSTYSLSATTMFSGVSLSDRLKAAVNQLEATGTSLQQRALTAAQQAQTPPERKVSNPAAKADDRPQSPRSPPPVGSAANLADSALSGLNELRRSFSNFRNSQEGSRPSSADIDAAGKAQKSGSSPLRNAEADKTEKAEKPKEEPKGAGKPDDAATEGDAKDPKDKSEHLAPQFDLGTPNTSAAVSGQATPAPPETTDDTTVDPSETPAPAKGEPTPTTETAAKEPEADVFDAPTTNVESDTKDVDDTESAAAATPATTGGGNKKKKKNKGKKGGNTAKPDDSKPLEDAAAAEVPPAEPATKDETSASDKPTDTDEQKKDDTENKSAAKGDVEVPPPIRLPTPTEDDPAKTLADTERRFEGKFARLCCN